MELWILNIQSEQQQQRDNNLQLADLHLCLLPMQTDCELYFSLCISIHLALLEPKETNTSNK